MRTTLPDSYVVRIYRHHIQENGYLHPMGTVDDTQHGTRKVFHSREELLDLLLGDVPATDNSKID